MGRHGGEETVAAPWLQRRWVGVALNVVAVVAAVAAYVLAALAGKAEAGARAALLVAGAAAAGLVALSQAARQLRDARRISDAEQVAVEAQEELTLTLNGALAPITGYLGELADAPSDTARSVVAGQLRQAAVDAAVRLSEPDARAAFYRRDDTGTILFRETYAGRSTLPRQSFHAGTEDGDTVLDLVERGDLVFIADVQVDPMVRPTTPGDYRTVIAVAVTAGDARLGMLTVDAPDVGDLSPSDVELVRVLANLLGCGLALAEASVRRQ